MLDKGMECQSTGDFNVLEKMFKLRICEPCGLSNPHLSLLKPLGDRNDYSDCVLEHKWSGD